jgi:hypothetical protein
MLSGVVMRLHGCNSCWNDLVYTATKEGRHSHGQSATSAMLSRVIMRLHRRNSCWNDFVYIAIKEGRSSHGQSASCPMLSRVIMRLHRRNSCWNDFVYIAIKEGRDSHSQSTSVCPSTAHTRGIASSKPAWSLMPMRALLCGLSSRQKSRGKGEKEMRLLRSNF